MVAAFTSPFLQRSRRPRHHLFTPDDFQCGQQNQNAPSNSIFTGMKMLSSLPCLQFVFAARLFVRSSFHLDIMFHLKANNIETCGSQVVLRTQKNRRKWKRKPEKNSRTPCSKTFFALTHRIGESMSGAISDRSSTKPPILPHTMGIATHFAAETIP